MELEEFIQKRVNIVDAMQEGDDKEKSIRNLVELVKANTDNLGMVYSNSLDREKLYSNEAIEREKLERSKEIEELKLAQSKEIEKIRSEQSKELEELRFNHEADLEAIRSDFAERQKKLEKSSKIEKGIQYTLQLAQIAVPSALFIYATKEEHENGYLPSMAKSILTKLPFFRK